MARTRPAINTARALLIVLVAVALVGCQSSETVTPPSIEDESLAGSDEGIALTEPDFLQFAGGDIFGDVAAGAGFVWVATHRGLIQVDPESMTAEWHTDLATGKKIVYAFDSIWVANDYELQRVDPVSLEVVAALPVGDPEGITADRDGIWLSEHKESTLARVDPVSNSIVERVRIEMPEGFLMGPAVIDGNVWAAQGNDALVFRVGADRGVTPIDLPREVLTPAFATLNAIWLSNLYDPWITRIDRTSNAITAVDLPSSAVGPLGGVNVGVDIDGTPWFPSSGGQMIAIDPLSSEVIGSVPLQGVIPRNSILYSDALWVMSEEGGSLERVDLDRLKTD